MQKMYPFLLVYCYFYGLSFACPFYWPRGVSLNIWEGRKHYCSCYKEQYSIYLKVYHLAILKLFSLRWKIIVYTFKANFFASSTIWLLELRKREWVINWCSRDFLSLLHCFPAAYHIPSKVNRNSISQEGNANLTQIKILSAYLHNNVSNTNKLLPRLKTHDIFFLHATDAIKMIAVKLWHFPFAEKMNCSLLLNCSLG